MVFAANDVGDAELDVVDYGAERVERPRIGTEQHGVAQVPTLEPYLAPCEVGPCHIAVLEQKAPVGPVPGGAVALALRVGHRKAGAVRSDGHTSELQSLMRISYA